MILDFLHEFVDSIALIVMLGFVGGAIGVIVKGRRGWH